MANEETTDKRFTSIWTTRLVVVIAFACAGLGLGIGYIAGQGGVEAQPRSLDRLGSLLPETLQPKPKAPEFKPPQEAFLRLNADPQGMPLSLDIAISTYRPVSGEEVEVALVGAVHIADEEFFQAMNQELARYDSVLYELVAPKNMRPTPDMKKDANLLSSFQNTLSDLLHVRHQLDLIDYRPDHFVHADLSMQELVEEGKRRGETPFTLAAGITLDMMRLVRKAEQDAQRSGAAPAAEPQSLEEMIDMLSDPVVLRRQFASVLAGSEGDDAMAGFTTLTPYLIEARNQAAMEVLREELAQGNKRIAIFYGAAHMPDFERRLDRELRMKRVATRWVRGWDLTKDLPKRDPLQLFIGMFRQAGASS